QDSSRGVWESLSALLDRGIVRETPAGFVLADHRQAQAALSDLAPAARSGGHRRWADALQGRLGAAPAGGSRLPMDVVARLVAHRQAVGELLSVAGFVLQQAEQAAAAHAYQQAWESYRWVLEHKTDAAPDERLRLTLRAGELAERAGAYGPAQATL